ncbi:MAG: hypothetical protein ACFNZO_03145 [Candidatus Saccharibacteria bacterium]
MLRKTANCLRNSIAELVFEAGIDDDIMLSLFEETSDLALVGLSVVLNVSSGDKVILSEEELRKIHESFDNEGKVSTLQRRSAVRYAKFWALKNYTMYTF